MWHLENFLPLKLAQFVKKYYLCSRKLHLVKEQMRK